MQFQMRWETIVSNETANNVDSDKMSNNVVSGEMTDNLDLDQMAIIVNSDEIADIVIFLDEMQTVQVQIICQMQFQMRYQQGSFILDGKQC